MEKFKDITDKFQSLYTILVYNTTVQELIDDLYLRLEKIQKITDTFKKKYLNDRFYSFIEFIKSKKREDKLNTIFLVSSSINELIITKSQLNLLYDYQVPKIIVKNDNNFDIEYLDDLLNNNNYYDIIQLKNNELKYYHMTKTKRKLVKTVEEKSLKIIDYLPDNKSRLIIHGSSGLLKNFTLDNVPIYKVHLTDHEIFEIFNKIQSQKNHQRLEKEVFIVLQKDPADNKILVGNKLVKYIKDMNVKTLFGTPLKIKKLKEIFDSDLLNFEIVEINKLESGDYGDKLYTDYRGLIGVSYY
jgi:hypothetical protein